MTSAVGAAFEPIVPPELFQRAQERRLGLFRHWTDEEYLAALRRIWGREGRLSRTIIDADQETPDSASYYYRFGNLTKIYNLIGYEAESLAGPLPDGTVRTKRLVILRRALAYFRAAGLTIHMHEMNQVELNGKITVQLQVVRCVPSRRGAYWKTEICSKYLPDYMVVARLNPGAESVHDYYILPTAAPDFKRYQLFRENNAALDRFKSVDLSPLVGLATTNASKSAAIPKASPPPPG